MICTSNLKESCVLVIRHKIIDKKSVKKVNSVKKMKRFYHIYRLSETGQLRKRFVKRLFHEKPNGYRWVHKILEIHNMLPPTTLRTCLPILFVLKIALNKTKLIYSMSNHNLPLWKTAKCAYKCLQYVN